jgi:hypothetical protein
MRGADGKLIQPTNKKFYLEFCTVANWNRNSEILEERLFYDQHGYVQTDRCNVKRERNE